MYSLLFGQECFCIAQLKYIFARFSSQTFARSIGLTTIWIVGGPDMADSLVNKQWCGSFSEICVPIDLSEDV